ncbi:hypothetical protein TNCV_4687881 [Trichonephila clavipes]|nr:hypothetical protein TNCV_4687881 [Trichonephila clavipes]
MGISRIIGDTAKFISFWSTKLDDLVTMSAVISEDMMDGYGLFSKLLGQSLTLWPVTYVDFYRKIWKVAAKTINSVHFLKLIELLKFALTYDRLYV